MTRLRDAIDWLAGRLIIAVFNTAAWALNRYKLREPW